MTLHPGGCGSLWRLLLYRYVVGEDDLLRDASWVSAIGSAAEAADPKVWRVAFLQAASEFHVGGPMFRTSNEPCAALLEAGALGVPKTASPAPYSDMPPDAAVVKTAFFLVDHIFSPNEFHSKSSIPRGLQAPLAPTPAVGRSRLSAHL